MNISKNISYGELIIDTENGRIWVNAPSCVLRIQNLNFKNKEEKFSMIDISKNDAHMYKDTEDETNYYSQFLEVLNYMIIPKLTDVNDQKDYLDKLIMKIKDVIQ